MNVDNDEHDASTAGLTDHAKKRPLSGSASPPNRVTQRARVGTPPRNNRDTSRPPAPAPIPARPRLPTAPQVQQPDAVPGRAARELNSGDPGSNRSRHGGPPSLTAVRVHNVVPAANVKPDLDVDAPASALPRPRARRSPPLEPYVAPASPVRPKAAPPVRAQHGPAQAGPPVAPNQGPPPGTYGNRNAAPAAVQPARAPVPQVNIARPAPQLPGQASVHPRHAAPLAHAQVAPVLAHVPHVHAVQPGAPLKPAPARGAAGPNPAVHAHRPAQAAGVAAIPVGAARAQAQPSARKILMCTSAGCQRTFQLHERDDGLLHVIREHCPPSMCDMADSYIFDDPRLGLVCRYKDCCCSPRWPRYAPNFARAHVIEAHLKDELRGIAGPYLIEVSTGAG